MLSISFNDELFENCILLIKALDMGKLPNIVLILEFVILWFDPLMVEAHSLYVFSS